MFPDINLRSNLYTTEDFLDSLQVSKTIWRIKIYTFVKRIFDMWTGDWNNERKLGVAVDTVTV